ncbi:MAG: hypothetical protein ACFCVK_25895 [Acidimicrobiales bacterium]
MRHLDPPPAPEHDLGTLPHPPAQSSITGAPPRVTVPATGIEPTTPVPIVRIEAPEPVLVLGGIPTPVVSAWPPPAVDDRRWTPTPPSGAPTMAPVEPTAEPVIVLDGASPRPTDIPLARLAPSLLADAAPLVVDRRPELPPPTRFSLFGGVDELRDLARHATNGVVIACLLLAAVPMTLIGIRLLTTDDDVPLRVVDGTTDPDARPGTTGPPPSTGRAVGVGTSQPPAEAERDRPVGPSRPGPTPPGLTRTPPTAAVAAGGTGTTLTHPATTVLVGSPSTPTESAGHPETPVEGPEPTVLDNVVTRPENEVSTTEAPTTTAAAPAITARRPATTARSTTTSPATTSTTRRTTTTRATTTTGALAATATTTASSAPATTVAITDPTVTTAGPVVTTAGQQGGD